MQFFVIAAQILCLNYPMNQVLAHEEQYIEAEKYWKRLSPVELLDQVTNEFRKKRYSIRAEQACLEYMKWEL